ncbi:697_t:CDS:2 [Acaulospora morrowiae]|uniref:697_t:CDS:1 n=1 Tax=Acaulospora morrowiae TaxID=94023 RepID=A0A9N8YYX2_9GLOM|nr:697_t:CDS:2 [Acaulospora morrowiae]
MPLLIPSYDDKTLQKLYPDYLSLRLVQVIHRHGERAPRKRLTEFIPGLWNLCHAAQACILLPQQGIDELHFEFSSNLPPLSASLTGLAESSRIQKVISLPGDCSESQLTDIGRTSMSQLGAHLRDLYVNRLKFLDAKISDENDESIYLRSTYFNRTFESLHQLFIGGLYPSKYRENSFSLKIHTRDPYSENLYANHKCKRFFELLSEFQKTASSRHESKLKSLNEKLKPIVNEVSFSSNPSCNELLAKSNGIPLPKEFTADVIDDLNAVSTGRSFGGFDEIPELRRLGIGPLLFELQDQILSKIGNSKESADNLKLAIYSTHDVTIAPLLAALDAYENRRWPPFASHIIIELFQQKSSSSQAKIDDKDRVKNRKTVDIENQGEYFVRVKYNNKILELSGCQKNGTHHTNDKSLCTLKAFLEILNEQIPVDFEKECHVTYKKTKKA